MSDITDRARELADRLLDGNLEGKSFTEWIVAALQREWAEAEARAVAWYCADVPEDELDSFGVAALASLRAAIRGDKL